MNEEIDWMHLPASERVEPSKLLYKALKAVSDVTGREIDLLMDDAYGEPNTTSPHYASNFRRGKVAAGKAMMIHTWLAENHFKIAQTVAPELFQFNPKTAWELFVEQRAIQGQLSIKHLKQDLGLIDRDDGAIPVGETLRLTQRFCFEIKTDLRGVALAFQKYEGDWHPLPLGANKLNPWANVKADPQFLPHKPDGKPIGLRENDDAGQHKFAVIVSEDRKLPNDMAKLAKLDQSGLRFEVHTITLRFVT